MNLGHATGLIDVHAHIGAEEFDTDRREVIERARANGVNRIVAVGETLTEAERNLELTKEYPGRVLAAAGLYPTSCRSRTGQGAH